MNNIYKIEEFLFGTLQNLLNTNSIDRDDLDCFHRILYQEQNGSFESKKINSLIFIILSLLTPEIKINQINQEQNTKIANNRNLKYNKDYTIFHLEGEANPNDKIDNAMKILTNR